jgi:hypothetical protein
VTNLELAERAYDALARDDLDGFLELVDPDVEFNSLVAEAEGVSFHGHEGVREWWDGVKTLLGGLEWDLDEIREIDEDKLIVRHTIKGRLGEARLAQTAFQAGQRRGDKAIWWGIFRTEAEALAALDERP